MTAGTPEFDDVARMSARLQQFSVDTQRRAEQFQQVSAALAESSVREQAEGGAISVTVSSSGSLTGLQLTDRAREMPAERLAAAILGCVQRAQAGIADRAQQIVAETVRDDSPQASQIADSIVATFRNNFPPPAETTAAEPQQHAPDVGGLAERHDADRSTPDRRPPPEDDEEPGGFLR